MGSVQLGIRRQTQPRKMFLVPSSSNLEKQLICAGIERRNLWRIRHSRPWKWNHHPHSTYWSSHSTAHVRSPASTWWEQQTTITTPSSENKSVGKQRQRKQPTCKWKMDRLQLHPQTRPIITTTYTSMFSKGPRDNPNHSRSRNPTLPTPIYKLPSCCTQRTNRLWRTRNS